MNDRELAELDLAVAKAEGFECWIESGQCFAKRDGSWGFMPTRDTVEAMRLLEKYELDLYFCEVDGKPAWDAGHDGAHDPSETPCVAIARAVVALHKAKVTA